MTEPTDPQDEPQGNEAPLHPVDEVTPDPEDTDEAPVEEAEPEEQP